MKLSGKIILTTIAVGIPAFVLGRILWPPAPDLPVPTSAQLPFFALLAIVEALFFGLGAAFVIFGISHLKAALPEKRKEMLPPFVSLAWLLVSWWPHDNLHFHVGEDLQGILYIDYGFHLTVIIASLIVARYFFKLLQKEGRPEK